MNSSLYAAWLAELGIITYRAQKQKEQFPTPIKGLPLPAEYGSTFVIYGILSFIPGRGAPVASLFGWGLVIATLLNLWEPGSFTAKNPKGTIKPVKTQAGTGKGTTASPTGFTSSNSTTPPTFNV